MKPARVISPFAAASDARVHSAFWSSWRTRTSVVSKSVEELVRIRDELGGQLPVDLRGEDPLGRDEVLLVARLPRLPEVRERRPIQARPETRDDGRDARDRRDPLLRDPTERPRSICCGEKLSTWTLTLADVTIGSPLESPLKRSLKVALMSSASVPPMILSASSGVMMTPGTPRFRRRAAVKDAASSSVNTSCRTDVIGDRPIRVFSGSSP